MPDNLQSSSQLSNASVALSQDGALELRITPVCGSDDSRVTHLDLRLFRRVSTDLGAGVYGQTAAGFRIPLRSVPEVVGKLFALTKEAESKGD